MQLKILSTNSLLKSITFLINYAVNNIFNIENMLNIIRMFIVNMLLPRTFL